MRPAALQRPRLRLAELAAYEATTREQPSICDVPPIFRLRLQCLEQADELDLLAFLRRNGVFACQVPGGLEAGSVDSKHLEAPRELIARVADWFSQTDAALNIWLA